jgi:hypothetical protein
MWAKGVNTRALCYAIGFCAAFATIGTSWAQSPAPSGEKAPAEAAKGNPACAEAALHWSSTESIGTREAYKDHLARFPTCAFATLAAAKIAALEGKTQPSPTAANPDARLESRNKPVECDRGETLNAEGKCVRKQVRETREPAKRVVRRTAPAAAPAQRPSGGTTQLDCNGPIGFAGCVSHALSKSVR